MIINPYIFGGATNPLWNGLQAYYTADSTPNDAIGSNNGTLVNGATYGTGIINQGFSLDGVNDYIDMGTSFPIITGDMTLSFWFKGSFQNASVGHLNRMGGPGFRGFLFGANNTNNFLRFDISPDGLTLKQLTYSHGSTFSATTWYHAVAVFKTSSYMRIYLNGSQVAEETASIPSTQTQPSSFVFDIGKRGSLMGVTDEIGVWNRELTPTEVTELYNSGSALQYS